MYVFIIAFRYMRKRLITWLTAVSISLLVWLFVVVMSVLLGFGEFLHAHFRKTNAHIEIDRASVLESLGLISTSFSHGPSCPGPLCVRGVFPSPRDSQRQRRQGCESFGHRLALLCSRSWKYRPRDPLACAGRRATAANPISVDAEGPT